jgi:cell division protein FtsB
MGWSWKTIAHIQTLILITALYVDCSKQATASEAMSMQAAAIRVMGKSNDTLRDNISLLKSGQLDYREMVLECQEDYQNLRNGCIPVSELIEDYPEIDQE